MLLSDHFKTQILAGLCVLERRFGVLACWLASCGSERLWGGVIGKLVLRAVLRATDLLIGKLVFRAVWGVLTCYRVLLQVGCRGPPGGGEGPMVKKESRNPGWLASWCSERFWGMGAGWQEVVQNRYCLYYSTNDQSVSRNVYVDIKILTARCCLPLPRGNRDFLSLQQKGQSDKAFFLTSNFVPKRLSVMYKSMKNMYKIRLQRGCFKLATNGQNDKAFLLTWKFWPKGVVYHCTGLHTCTWIKHLKMSIKSDFKEIILNLQQMGKVIRSFCWH